MESKMDQRKKYLVLRKSINSVLKDKMDVNIFNRVINTKEYVENKVVLTYVSKGFEVDTIRLIKYSLSIGKEVYVPFVTDKKRVMEFYKINSLDELNESNFGVLEPLPNETNKYKKELKGLCIVPAIAVDYNGYRIGYGGGYYDYFLRDNNCCTFGLVYNEFMVSKIEIDEFDKRVDYIVTEDIFKRI